MSYYESAEDITITRKRAIRELHAHGVTSTEEQTQALEHAQIDDGRYDAQLLLDWLGY